MQDQIHNNYVGWVPCLNGQLVFDLIECGLNDNRHRKIEIAHYANDRNNNTTTEYILLHSTVNWKDFDDKEKKWNGLWSVVIVSRRSLESNEHQGHVYLMLKENNSKKQNELLDFACKINYDLKTKESVSDVPERLSTLEESMTEMCSATKECYKVKFKLEQDGIVWLDPSSEDQNNRRIIARQAYYYIKYSWHKHQHHDSRSETLTTVHECNKNLNKDSKKHIALKIIGDLKRNLVKFKRETDTTSHREILKAKGIVSYAKALVEIMKYRGYIDNNLYQREINHLEYFGESLGIISSGIEKDMALYNQAVNHTRAFILFIFAMVTPALVINKLKNNTMENSPDYIQWISKLYSNGESFTILWE